MLRLPGPGPREGHSAVTSRCEPTPAAVACSGWRTSDYLRPRFVTGIGVYGVLSTQRMSDLIPVAILLYLYLRIRKEKRDRREENIGLSSHEGREV
jgi:hypothetical protein